MFDIIVSDLPAEEPCATVSGAVQLLLALGIAFVVLVVLIWLCILLAGYIRKNAAKVKMNLGENTPVSAEAEKDDPPQEK